MRAAGIFFLAAAVLAGCATDTPPAAPPAPREHWLKDASAVAAAMKPGAQNASGVAAPATAITGDPLRIEFDPMGATLDDNDKAKIAALVSQAQSARSVSIRGFCDRTKIGNAKAAALARANVVKKEFVAAGVPAAKIKVRFTTDKPESAALISFE